jgi:hypothetical protein
VAYNDACAWLVALAIFSGMRPQPLKHADLFADVFVLLVPTTHLNAGNMLVEVLEYSFENGDC